MACYTLLLNLKTCITSPLSTCQMTMQLSYDAVIANSDVLLNPHHVVASPCYSKQCRICQVSVSHILAEPSLLEVINYLLLGLNDAQITFFIAFLIFLTLTPCIFYTKHWFKQHIAIKSAFLLKLAKNTSLFILITVILD